MNKNHQFHDFHYILKYNKYIPKHILIWNNEKENNNKLLTKFQDSIYILIINLKEKGKNNNVITNTERNELGQVYKIGDFYSDTNLIREKLGIMNTETIKDISRATLNVPDKIYMGVLVLTDFRLIYKMEI